MCPHPSASSSRLMTVLVLLLLAVRFLYLGVTRFITWPSYPPWLLPSEEVVTYLLIAVAIYTGRRRLGEFHITSLALAMFVIAPFLDIAAVVTTHFRLEPYEWLSRGIEVTSAVLLFAILSRARELKAGLNRDSLLGLSAGIGIGIALGLVFGTYFVIRDKPSAAVGGLSQFAALAAFQLRGAAIMEEPLFRGFGWGQLSHKGWRDTPILLTQALLFSVSHLYYLRFALFSFFVLVPAVGLCLGILARRTKSIASTVLAHTFINAVAIFWGRV